jgi:uncharacterized delta-60 repeat protein
MLRSRRKTRLIMTLASLTLTTFALAGCPIPGGSSGPGGNTSTGGNTPVTPGSSGSLDKSFGDDGILTTDFTEEKDDAAFGVALQADGKIVAAGSTSAPDPSYTVGTFALVRYLSNGEPDPAFGMAGRVFTAQGSTAQARDVVVTGDGQIVTGGWFQAGGFSIDYLLSRHLSDGKLDESFGDAGHATAGLGAASGNALALQADGKFLFTGYNGLLEYKPVVARYTAAGELDTSFDEDGKAQLDWGTDSDEAYAIAVHDGKILVAGSADTDGFALSRLNADGTLDTSFGTDGTVKVAAGESEASDLAVAADGTIVVVGGQHVLRFTADGELDTGFGGDGIVELTDHALNAVALQPDGKILVTGGHSEKVSLSRLKADGSLDSSFATQGTAIVAVPEATAQAYDIVRQPDGRIVVAGRAFQSDGAHADFMLMRFWP